MGFFVSNFEPSYLEQNLLIVGESPKITFHLRLFLMKQKKNTHTMNGAQDQINDVPAFR